MFEGGFHKPKEELPLKWEIPYRIFREDFEQLSFRTWSGVKLNENQDIKHQTTG